ncbi:MAG: hypothetical protein K2P78_05980 [Gemmataceae bacterium]|nr:hypothetical protein [Gemmataceae bacterium]
MTTVRVEATVEADGELRLTDLPYRRGDRVEAVLLGPGPGPDREGDRAAALGRFLALARASAFRSAGPLPTRDDLHDRA